MTSRILFGICLVFVLLVGLFEVPSASANDYRSYYKGARAFEALDYAEALRRWRPLAEKGDAPAQTGLGIMYEHGKGVQQDFVEAASWYRKAADQHYAEAQHYLGLMYLNGRQFEGRGILKDLGTVRSWIHVPQRAGCAAGLYRGSAMVQKVRQARPSCRTKQSGEYVPLRTWSRAGLRPGRHLVSKGCQTGVPRGTVESGCHDCGWLWRSARSSSCPCLVDHCRWEWFVRSIAGYQQVCRESFA